MLYTSQDSDTSEVEVTTDPDWMESAESFSHHRQIKAVTFDCGSMLQITLRFAVGQGPNT